MNPLGETLSPLALRLAEAARASVLIPVIDGERANDPLRVAIPDDLPTASGSAFVIVVNAAREIVGQTFAPWRDGGDLSARTRAALRRWAVAQGSTTDPEPTPTVALEIEIGYDVRHWQRVTLKDATPEEIEMFEDCEGGDDMSDEQRAALRAADDANRLTWGNDDDEGGYPLGTESNAAIISAERIEA